MDYYLGQGFGLLSNIYSVIDHYVFNDAILTAFNDGSYTAQIGNIDLVATILSLIGVIFVVAIPFLLVWRVCKMIGGH